MKIDADDKTVNKSTLKGKVVIQETDAGIPGLQVILWADREGQERSFGPAITDEQGEFAISHTGVAESIDLATNTPFEPITRTISEDDASELLIEISPKELRAFMPRPGMRQQDPVNRWKREAALRRAYAHEKATRQIERFQRRRAFGTSILNRIDLSSIPKDLRDQDQSFIESGASREERSDRLIDIVKRGISDAETQARTIQVDVEKIVELEGLSGEKKLPLNKILRFGVGPVQPKIDDDVAQVLQNIRRHAKANLTKSRFGEKSSTEDTKELEEPNETGSDNDPSAEGDPPPEIRVPTSATAYVKFAVRNLSGDGSDRSLAIPPKNTQDTLEDEVGQVSLNGGPSDVTSFHEFQSLRIAFEPLWEELYDPELSNLVEVVFGGLARFEEDLPFDEIDALEALKPFLDLAEELGADLDEPLEILTPDDDVRTLLPDLSPLQWTNLSEGLREDLALLGQDLAKARATIYSAGGLTAWPHSDLDGHYSKSNADDPQEPPELVTLTNPNLFRIAGHSARIFYDDENWADRANILTTTGIDVYPQDIPAMDIYTFVSDQQRYIRSTTRDAIRVEDKEYVRAGYAYQQALGHLAQKAEDKLYAELPPDSPEEVGQEPFDLVAENNLEALARILTDIPNYRFKLFSPGSVNFGILLKYRQAWEPLNYQVGDLVQTMPLAPKESRKYKKHVAVKKTRNRKEIENALQTKSDAEETTGRAEAEIIRRAKNATNFQATAEGKGSVGVAEFGGSVSAGTSAEQESAKNKKKFRQAVQKAAHEYRQERKVEISTVDSEELETTESGEITNPNEELTVTYMFYELQKRFFLSENLVDVEPVVMVAHDVPLPSEITESWLIRHDWILKRVILDDSFLPTFELLRESNKARDVLIGVLKDNLVRNVKTYREIKEQAAANARVREETNRALKKAIEARVDAINADPSGAEEAADVALTIFTSGLFGSAGLLGVGGMAGQGEGMDSPEAAEQRQEATEEMLARIGEEARRLRSLLEAAEVAVERAIQQYSEAVRARLNKELAVLRLRTHIAQNILHYMQAIWEYEPPDQRFFRLYDLQVPVIQGEVNVEVGEDNVTLTFSSESVNLRDTKWQRLADVADLDALVGYKGSYMIFPLREHNYFTAWMVQKYLDGGGKVKDPDDSQTSDHRLMEEMGEILTVELNKLHGEAKIDSHPEPEGIRQEIERLEKAAQWLEVQIELAEPTSDTVVVPTDLLFIEALPGEHPLLEDFKLIHRSMDVARVATEVRAAEIDNIRRTARILDGDYEDPEIDKRLIIEGGNAAIETNIG